MRLDRYDQGRGRRVLGRVPAHRFDLSGAMAKDGNGELRGKVAIVTGGGTGIGYAIARTFAEAGASVVLAGRHPERLGEAGDPGRRLGGAGCRTSFRRG